MSKGTKRERGKPINRLLTIENKLMVTRREVGRGWVKLVMEINKCTCDEQQVFHVSVEINITLYIN